MMRGLFRSVPKTYLKRAFIFTGTLQIISLLGMTAAATESTSSAHGGGKPVPTIIAHRGASGYLPEHTLPAAAYAYALGVDFIEPDVVLSKDGVPVVLHDIHLEMTTNVAQAFPKRQRPDGRWYAVDFTLAELRTLAVGERRDAKSGKPVFPGRFPAATAIFRIPTLEEMIQLVQGLNRSTGRDVGLYPELKAPAFHTQAGQDIAKIVLPLLARYGYKDKADNLYLQCFDPQALKRIRHELKSSLRLVQLIGENSWKESDADYDAMRTEAGIKAVAEYADGIGPSLSHVVAFDANGKAAKATELVGWARANKLLVHAYTIRADSLPPGVASLDELHGWLFDTAGVDGAFSDFADASLTYVRKRRPPGH